MSLSISYSIIFLYVNSICANSLYFGKRSYYNACQIQTRSISDEELNSPLALFVKPMQLIIRQTHFMVWLPQFQHYLKGKKRNIRLVNNDKFSFLRYALDATTKESALDGLGLAKNPGEDITLEEAEQFWSKGA